MSAGLAVSDNQLASTQMHFLRSTAPCSLELILESTTTTNCCLEPHLFFP